MEDQHKPIPDGAEEKQAAKGMLARDDRGATHSGGSALARDDVDLSGVEKVHRFPGGLRR